MKKFVIAGTSSQFYDWMRKNGYSHTVWRYVSGLDTIRGYSNPHGIFIGTWYERPDMLEVVHMLRLCTNIKNEKLDEVFQVYMNYRLGLEG